MQMRQLQRLLNVLVKPSLQLAVDGVFGPVSARETPGRGLAVERNAVDLGDACS
jgi:hypothetical protein